MSKKELNCLLVVEKCAGKALPQLEGARLLGISVRQLRRLIKGFRAERANQTLQDRLVKALRLANISNIEQANAFLPQFIERFNQRFAKPPRKPENLHRPVHHSSEELEAILSIQTKRKLSKNLTISLQNIEFQLKDYGKGYRLRNKEVTICQHFNGEISLYCEGKRLSYQRFEKGQKAPPMISEKELDTTMTRIKKKAKSKPAKNHPWRRWVEKQAISA